MHWLLSICVLANSPALACHDVAKNPFKLAIAGGSLTEIVYFLGVEDRIVATDTPSNFPDGEQERVQFARALLQIWQPASCHEPR